MKRWMTLAFALILAPSAHASYGVSTFEDLRLAPNSYNDNAGASGQFVSGGVSFGNTNNGGFDHGFVISSLSSTTPADYTNPYAAVTGIGAGGSATYAVGFTYGSPAFNESTDPNKNSAAYISSNPFHPSDTYVTLAAGQSPQSIQITNTSYTYSALKNGTGFTTPFAQGDFQLLDVRGYSANGTLLGDVNFYLADYRSANSTNWYIVNAWTNVDLSSLAGARTLQFGITSSQNDATYGVNEPSYFAADNFTFSTNSVPEPASLVLLSAGLVVVAAASRLRRTRIDA